MACFSKLDCLFPLGKDSIISLGGEIQILKWLML